MNKLLIAAAIFSLATGPAAAQVGPATPEQGGPPEVTAERPDTEVEARTAVDDEARPARGERWRERREAMRERMRERRGMRMGRYMHRGHGPRAAMRGPGIHLQLGQDRLFVACSRRDTTEECVEAAMPVVEAFLDQLEGPDTGPNARDD